MKNLIFILFLLPCIHSFTQSKTENFSMILHDDWRMQSSVFTVTNTGKAVAFFIHIRILKEKNDDDILPVIFSDNYISLAPGESRTIECSYENKDAGNLKPHTLISGWNIDKIKSNAGKDAGFE